MRLLLPLVAFLAASLAVAADSSVRVRPLSGAIDRFKLYGDSAELTESQTPGIPGAEAELRGAFKRSDWSLLADGEEVAIAGDGTFKIRVPVRAAEARVEFQAVGPDGRIEKAEYMLFFSDEQTAAEVLSRFKTVAAPSGSATGLALGLVDLGANAALAKSGSSYAGSIAWDPRYAFHAWRLRGVAGLSLFKGKLKSVYPSLDLGLAAESAVFPSIGAWIGIGYHLTRAIQAGSDVPRTVSGPGLSLSYDPRFGRNSFLERVDRLYAGVKYYDFTSGIWFFEYGVTLRLGK